MEYFQHGNLLSVLEFGSCAEYDAKIITMQLLEGLRIMHNMGITHRDLKPQVSHACELSQNLQRVLGISNFNTNRPSSSLNAFLSGGSKSAISVLRNVFEGTRLYEPLLAPPLT